MNPRISLLAAFVALGAAALAQPALFVPNQGQWADDFAWRIDVPSGALFLEDDAFTWNFRHPDDVASIQELKEQRIEPPPGGYSVRGHAFRTRFVGAGHRDRPTRMEAVGEPASHWHNYYLGADPDRWRGRVPLYDGVRYTDLYPGIDLIVHSHTGALKYDLIVQPGARPGFVEIAYEGDVRLSLRDGALHVRHTAGDWVEAAPVAWQEVRGERRPVDVRFVLRGERVGFEIGRYDSRHPLVIDPVFIFGTFSGSTSDNWGYTATFDESGHLYGGGIVFGTGYPTTLGAYQEFWGGGGSGLPCDIGISKYTPDGTGQVWATYLGGSDNELPHSLVVNAADELFVYGTTGSNDYPITGGVHDNTFGGGTNVSVTSIGFSSGTDIIISRLSADGSNLLASTYVGGSLNDGLNTSPDLHYNYGDHARGEIILDPAGNPVVASSTYSVDFPATAGAFQPSSNGEQEGVLFRLNASLSLMTWATYLGGSLDDGAYSVKIDGTGDLLVCGGTESTDFPTTAGTVSPTYGGGVTDGWVARINPTGSGMVAGTYLGTPSYDQSYFVERDDGGHVYVVGQSLGGFLVTPGIYSEPGGRQFIAKLEPNLNAFEYSTVFGSGASINISPSAFLVDVCENVYVSGWGGQVNNGFNPATGTTNGMSLTADAFQSTTDGSDFYFFVLSKNAISLLYASYFGGFSTGLGAREHVDGGTSRFDRNGIVYQAVCAGCTGTDLFPTTPGAWSETNASPNCNLGTLKFEFDLSGVYAESQAFPAIAGCVPFTVDFENTSTGATDYIWDFDDGAFSTLFEPTHTFTAVGTYNVALVAIDSNSCNIADTSYLTILVGLDSIAANFDLTQSQNCDTLWANFGDLSFVLGPSTAYTWDFGDGSGDFTAGDVAHMYTTPGTYTVTLIIEDSTSCNLRDTFSLVIDYESAFDSGFTVDYDGCVPITATFENDYLEADAYTWDFGDGNTATGIDPVHVYDSAGSYTVTLTSEACGVEDITTIDIDVPADPIAFFDPDPAAAIINTPVTFTNWSQFATAYVWDFGDGSMSADVNPTHVFAGQGTWTVCLTARNGYGCEDVYCREIDIEFDGMIDVPNAFHTEWRRGQRSLPRTGLRCRLLHPAHFQSMG